MVNTIKSGLSSAFSAATHFVQPITSALNRAVIDPVSSVIKHATTAPGMPAFPDPQLPAAAASSPTAKPQSKGIQSSFLSGVAGSSLNQGGGSSTGKSLLGQ